MDDLRPEINHLAVDVMFRMNMACFPETTTKFSPLMEGTGVLIVNREADHRNLASSSTMWFFKTVAAEEDDPLFTHTQTISCPICECPTPLWYIRRHCETCAELARIGNQIKACNDSISALHDDVKDKLKSMSTRSFVTLPLQVFSRKKRKRLNDISNILQIALELPTYSPKGMHTYDLGQHPPSLEPEILQVRTWCAGITAPATASEDDLVRCIQDARSIIQQKVDNIARLHNVIRYSQTVWRCSSPRGGIPDSLKKFNIVKRLNKDATVSVFLTQTKHTAKLYVIKVIPKVSVIWKNCVNPDRMTIVRRQSPFVAKLNRVFQSKRNLYFVVRYLGGDDCASLTKPLGEIPTRIYIAEVALGLGFLHQNGIIHRFGLYSLKPASS